MIRWLVFLNFIAYFTACQTTEPAKLSCPPVDAWNGKIYMGDSHRFGVARSVASPVISCGAIEFNRMMCMSVEDYESLLQYFIRTTCVEL